MTLPLVAGASVDHALAVRRRLASLSAVRAVLGPTGVDSEAAVWLFTSQLEVVVEGSGLAAAVVSVQGAWTRPNDTGTAMFPRVRLEIIADSSRSGGLIVRRDAEARAWSVWQPFHDELDRNTAFGELWGMTVNDPGKRVWGSGLLSHPETFDIPEFDGGKKLICHYGLSVG